jgi:hypothetical protein
MTDEVLCVCVWLWGGEGGRKGVLGEHAGFSAAGKGEGLANSELGPHHHTLLRLRCFGGNWGHQGFGGNWGHWGNRSYSGIWVGRLVGLFIGVSVFSRVSRFTGLRRIVRI